MSVSTAAGTVPAAVAARREQGAYLRTLIGLLLLLPSLVLLLALYLIPLAIVLSRSFTEPSVGFENYAALWQSRAFRNIMSNTFQIAIATTLICLCVGYPFAYQVSRIPPWLARVVLLLCLVPFFTAILARLYAWTIILGDAGILNSYLLRTGILHEPLNLLFTRNAVVVGMVHVMLPYMILVLYSTMARIDRTLIEASRSLGAGAFATFWRVFLPLSMPGVYAGTLLVFIISLGFFITPAVLGGAHDVTIATFVRQEIGVLDWSAASAMSVVLLLVTVILFFFFNRLFGTDRLLTGGLRQ